MPCTKLLNLKHTLTLAAFTLALHATAQVKTHIFRFHPYWLTQPQVVKSNEDRKKEVFRQMYTQARYSQQALLDRFTLYPGVSAVRPLTVINAVLADCSPQTATLLAQEFPYIEITDISAYRYKMHEPVAMRPDEGSAYEKAAGAAEPGVVAIGTRAMWQMGYTGKGVKVLSFDTGVWPEHPALGGRFMGNFYRYSQSWAGYFAGEPRDKSSSHGTHTLGTMLGLQPQNADTLGIAFKAYFMSTDPIVSDLADLLPFATIIAAYDWALNPDNDTSTVSDMPDVICNSWGWVDPPDSALCTGFVLDMLENIENAGIASEFSAGNEGPGATTVGAPAFVTSSLVNAFAVGAINGNTPTYPIASFSSRGPGVCGGAGGLAIKPEVVAPGVNVRSCIGTNNYAFYDGTSMAGPHVAGALMLLREAFPAATARELKESLYFTAVDLGTPGEDDTYGMGIIHLPSAFTYLQGLGYTAATPADQTSDLAVELLNHPGNWACDATWEPVYELHNDAAVPVSAFRYKMVHNDVIVDSGTVNQTIAAGADWTFNTGVTLTWTAGRNEVWLQVENLSYTERDIVNNNSNFRTTYQPDENLPYDMPFNSVLGEWADWEVRNPDGLRTWEMMPSGGMLYCDSSITMRFPVYVNGTGPARMDYLVSPPVFIPNTPDTVYASFWAAYHLRLTNQRDTVELLAATDCKQNFNTVLFTGDKTNLTTYTATTPVLFVPSLEEHWKRHLVPLHDTLKGRTLYFAFRSKNYQGGNYYMNKFAVHTGSNHTSLETLSDGAFDVYPNPAADVLNVRGNNQGFDELHLSDVQGKTVYILKTPGAQAAQVPVHALAPGMYLLTVKHKQGRSVYKIIH